MFNYRTNRLNSVEFDFRLSSISLNFSIFPGEQWWSSGESARLPPLCPGFINSGTRLHMWVEFVVESLLCVERFFSGYFGFPLFSKPTFQTSFDPAMHGHFGSSSCELLGVPWVNKLHIYIYISFTLHTTYLRYFFTLNILDTTKKPIK